MNEIYMTPLANDDLDKIEEYIAKKVVDTILSKIEILKFFPRMGFKSKIDSKYRCLVYKNYIVFYTYYDYIIIVHRILHQKQNLINIL